MERHFIAVRKDTNIVEAIVSLETDESSLDWDEDHDVFEVPSHDVSLFGKKYVDGEFV